MNDSPVPTRRRFLALGLGAAAAAWGGALAASRDDDPCLVALPEARLAPTGEPGTRLRVEGLVFAPDGTTPAAGVVVYAYQTDATGVYASPGRPPRLRGWMRTDADGRFTYDTIRPAPYPGGRNPAHVHHQLWGAGWPAQWGNDLLFDDDPLVPEPERRRSASLGPFAFVRAVEEPPPHGAVVKLRLRLKTAGDRFEDGTRHGVDACRHARGGR
ncbi:MAG TPA: hypothetical protein PKA62_18500 [Thermoanaerobaculia bacterium]|nr:hypothetical protein [Thermoanaerobaculia bacterium]